MQESAKHLSNTLETGSRALAEWTLERHLARDPLLLARYAGQGRGGWVAAVEAHIKFLAQSVAVRRPGLFAALMRWEADGYEARGVPPDDLRQSLECLAEVLSSELPASAAPIGDHVRAALTGIDPATRHDAGSGPAPSAAAPSPQALAYLEALLDDRPRDAFQRVLHWAREGMPVRDLYQHVLGPAMAEIGKMWHRGEITVADEHVATAATQMVLSALRAFWPAGTIATGRRAVAAALEGDHHEIGLRMAADLLEMEGWAMEYIGVNTPADELVAYLHRRRVDLVILSVGSCIYLRSAGECIEKIRNTLMSGSPAVLVGGPPFEWVPDLWQELGADACAHDISQVAPLAHQLATQPRA